jgi:hypothetical protein
MNSFEICIQQYSFTKRCWWQLSSLAQQINKTNILYKLNIHKNDPFYKLNKHLISTFQSLVNLKVKIWDDERFFKRGDVRNLDLKEATKQWIIYADADVVFHPTFFSMINTISLKIDKMNVISRFNTSIDDGYSLVDSQRYEGQPIKKVVDRITKYPLRQSCSIGAGYFQLVNVNFIRSKGFNYSERSDSALNSKRGPSYRSDRHLRSLMGLNKIEIAPLYHINHYRLKDHKDVRLACQ